MTSICLRQLRIRAADVPGWVFGSILCGIDGSRPSLEAARQAAILAGSDTALTYAAVTGEQG